jgi:16S rRNA (guanine527-N7)-methyltransferase
MASKEFVVDRDGPLIRQLADALHGALSEDAADALGRYLQLVVTWNRKIDLTGAAQADAQVEVLLADALVLSDPALVPRAARIVDVGPGAGAPVLPLLLNRDDLSAVLVESSRKRVAFLRTAMGELGLDRRMRVIEQRLQPEAPAVEGQPFDVAISRATFEPGLWASIGASLSGRTLVFTAGDPPPPPPAGTARGPSVSYVLPGSGAPRRITVYETATDR